jgi:SRSO17 transposase
MERRFVVRLQQMMAEAHVAPVVFQGMLTRLEQFVEPFARLMQRSEQRVNARRYVAGLVSSVERKNVESIAYHHDQERQALQKFIGQAEWQYRPLLRELATQVGTELGEPDGVIVFDPSGFPKKGRMSVGVARQWCGRLGKIDNCQVGVYMAYVSRREHALVNFRLSLPKEWVRDKVRRRACGIPKGTRSQTRTEQALEMLEEQRDLLPHQWIVTDDELGRVVKFRRKLGALQERYLLAVPANTRVRDLSAAPPPYRGSGRPPQAPFVRVDTWRAALPDEAWTAVDVRDGEKGPLSVHIATARVVARAAEKRGPTEELLVVVRRTEDGKKLVHDYYLSNAAVDTPACELARASKAGHRIEDCLKRGKSEAGLADYEVRTWVGWHHHQTLSLIAAWFLTQETRRGKNLHTSDHGSAGATGSGLAAAPPPEMRSPRAHRPTRHAPTATKRTGARLSLETK